MLSVDKIYSLDLDADLVTLSACETGLSLIANGDDMVGLTRGFLYAGSSSVVASLWKVDDRATAELMKSFYTELLNSKVEALRKAQLETKEISPSILLGVISTDRERKVKEYLWPLFPATANPGPERDSSVQPNRRRSISRRTRNSAFRSSLTHAVSMMQATP